MPECTEVLVILSGTACTFEHHRTTFIVRISRMIRLKKRSSLDIISTILEAANGGIGKTRLIGKANLTTSQFNKYIQLLVSKNLLIETLEASHPTYKTTELGMQYVSLYGAIKSTLYLNSFAGQ